jgi:hypothetical protein
VERLVPAKCPFRFPLEIAHLTRLQFNPISATPRIASCPPQASNHRTNASRDITRRSTSSKPAKPRTNAPFSFSRDSEALRRGALQRGTNDDLDDEIQKKIKSKYPLTNIIFEDTREAVLFQSRKQHARYDLTKPRTSPICSISSTPMSNRTSSALSRRSRSSQTRSRHWRAD